ncbi:MAG TPA: hypothetical protein VN843_33725, partial [Anaerolineales bacterium]|nr:hypothetical protein [Anaerolineales bacterium]
MQLHISSVGTVIDKEGISELLVKLLCHTMAFGYRYHVHQVENIFEHSSWDAINVHIMFAVIGPSIDDEGIGYNRNISKCLDPNYSAYSSMCFHVLSSDS